MKKTFDTARTTALLTARHWHAHDPFTKSAATAYYAIFSLPGLLIIVTAIAALFFTEQRVEDEIVAALQSSLGPEAASQIQHVVEDTQDGNRDIWAMLIGILTLLFGATGVFAHLQRALNDIWEVEVRKSVGIVKFIKARITALGLILAIGFLLMISLSLTVMLTMLSNWLLSAFSTEVLFLIRLVNVAITFSIISFLFALIFKILPDVHVSWKPAMAGGALSALLFKAGEMGLNYYFETAAPGSAFGAAGALILLMLWVFYACMILLLGASFTKIYARYRCHEPVKTTELARKRRPAG